MLSFQVINEIVKDILIIYSPDEDKGFRVSIWYNTIRPSVPDLIEQFSWKSKM